MTTEWLAIAEVKRRVVDGETVAVELSLVRRGREVEARRLEQEGAEFVTILLLDVDPGSLWKRGQREADSSA